MTSSRPPFPTVLDSSLIAAWRACKRKGYLEYIEHWKTKGSNVHLHAGGAYAKGLEVARTTYYIDGKSEPEAHAAGLGALIHAYGDFECPPDSAKSLERMCGALEFYFDRYPMSTDKAIPAHLSGGRRGIEFSFAEPIDADHPETGDPLLYVGRLDMLAEFQGGYWGEDDKTTSQLGASWPKQWDLRSQFIGYKWGVKASSNITLTGFLIRGVSILKTKYDTLQAIPYFPDWMVDEWYEQLMHDIVEMKWAWETGYWAPDLSGACTEYGGCPFRQICLSEPSARVNWLQNSYERRKWDPVTRTETRLLDGVVVR